MSGCFLAALLAVIFAHLIDANTPTAPFWHDLVAALAGTLVAAGVARISRGYAAARRRRRYLRIPMDCGQRFRRKVDTDSDGSRTVIPIDPGQP